MAPASRTFDDAFQELCVSSFSGYTDDDLFVTRKAYESVVQKFEFQTDTSRAHARRCLWWLNREIQRRGLEPPTEPCPPDFLTSK